MSCHSTFEKYSIPTCIYCPLNVYLRVVSYHHILFNFAKKFFAVSFSKSKSLNLRFSEHFHIQFTSENFLESILDHSIKRPDQYAWYIAFWYHVKNVIISHKNGNVCFLVWVWFFLKREMTIRRVENVHYDLDRLLPVDWTAQYKNRTKFEGLLCDLLQS